MWATVFGDGPTDWLKKVVKRREVVDDNVVFRLHSVFTPLILVFFSGILTLEHFGVGTTAISCIHDKNDNENYVSFINTFCWITTTYTMAPVMDSSGESQGKVEKYHSYYQWVTVVLFLQGMLCYMPKYLWKHWNRGLLKQLVDGLNMSLGNDNVHERKAQVITYLRNRRKQFTMYMVKYWTCELLCLMNIVLQLFFMNKFLSGQFFRYGLDFMKYHKLDQENRFDPMISLFPRVTKCDFHSYGPSGTLEKRDIMCILPLNIINEKTYIFLWFWFAFLLFSLSLLVLYRILLTCFPCIRYRLLSRRHTGVSEYSASVACRKGNIGDWWVLYMLSKNVDPINYKGIIMGVAKYD